MPAAPDCACETLSHHLCGDTVVTISTTTSDNPSVAEREPAAGMDERSQAGPAGSRKIIGHPAMLGLMGKKDKAAPCVTPLHVTRPNTDNDRNSTKAALAKAVNRIKEFSAKRPREHSVTTAPVSLTGLPTEIVEHIAGMLESKDLVALSLTDRTNHARLHDQTLDAALDNISTPQQYDDAKRRISSLKPWQQAARLEVLIRKSNRSGQNRVNTYFELVDMLKHTAPDSRGKTIAAMSELIRTLEVRSVPLHRDQARAHTALLELAREMEPSLQLDVLRALANSPAPQASRDEATAALNELRAALAKPDERT